MKHIVLLFTLVFCALSVFGSSTLEKITVFLWCELEPFVDADGADFPLSSVEAARRVLEEARVIVSAMVYGYSFTYTPYDAKRNVAERFELAPVGEIAWGDGQLDIVRSEVRNKRLFATVSYTLADYQLQRIRAWESASVPSTGGIGEADLFGGYRERITSFRNSVKEAVRAHLRKQMFNKPREVTGEVLLVDSPSVFIKSGRYITKSVVHVNVRSVLPYVIF